jgi:hypothetical protein
MMMMIVMTVMMTVIVIVIVTRTLSIDWITAKSLYIRIYISFPFFNPACHVVVDIFGSLKGRILTE